jgi:hypothetical protein
MTQWLSQAAELYEHEKQPYKILKAEVFMYLLVNIFVKADIKIN